MTDLPNDIKSLKALIKQLLEKNAQLQAENAKMRYRLGLDSHNSHKPPSSDRPKKKTTQPGLPKHKNKKTGGQPRHKGNTHKRVASPNQDKAHLPQQSACYGQTNNTDDAHEKLQSRQINDLPEPKKKNTEQRLAQDKYYEHEQPNSYPPEETATVQYSPGERALVVKPTAKHKTYAECYPERKRKACPSIPIEQNSRMLEELHDHDPNSATEKNALKRADTLTEPDKAQNNAQQNKAKQTHIKETEERIADKIHNLHNITTETQTHLNNHEKRGAETTEMKAPTGTAEHNAWQPYLNHTQTRHALCGAHLLRQLQSQKENGALWAEDKHGLLLAQYNIPRPLADAKQIHPHYRLKLDQTDEEPSKRGKPKQPKGRNLLNRLRTHETGILAFALAPGIPFTNNQTERDLRPAKVKQNLC
jgi:transposase